MWCCPVKHSNKSFSPSEDDLELWQSFAEGIAPIARTPATAAVKPAKPRSKPARKFSPCAQRKTPQRQKKGTIHVEATLDLHGLTQQQAHQSVNSFLQTACFQKKRCVLIITGKGGSLDSRPWWEERGILRNIVPHWLESNPNKDKVQNFAPAHPKHGGNGALYVFLKSK